MSFSRTAAIILLITTPIVAEVETEIPLGIEAVTGIRSAYVRNGIDTADAVLDFQLESEIALTNEVFLTLGAWHVAESNGTFNETAISAQLTHQWETFSLTGELAYHNFDSLILDSGIDLSLELIYTINRNASVSGLIGYDDGAESAYGQLEFNYSHPLSEDAYWAFRGGITIANDYYGLSGLSEIYSRLSLTYNINSQLSLTPFIGISEAPDADTTAYAGVWFAVSF